jgi:hypothetical protein
MLTINSPKLAAKFVCEKCDYKCCKKSDYEKHLYTKKHLSANNPNDKANIVSQEEKKYNCNKCGISIKHLSSLSRHRKKCLNEDFFTESKNEIIDKKNINEFNPENFKILTNLIMEVVKSNTDLQKQVLDVCKNNNNHNNNNSNNTNSHNKTFNLQFFLNEQCKDAMNIMEFVDTFQLQFSDLERVGEVGYVEGISSIIIDKLSKMDIYKRPIHCSDAKREIMHIKDNDVWEKDNESNDKLRLAIKHITKKNMDLVNLWADKHPGVREYNHRLNDKYQLIIIESVGGMKNDTIKDGETKIIKKISKMVLIDKSAQILL